MFTSILKFRGNNFRRPRIPLAHQYGILNFFAEFNFATREKRENYAPRKFGAIQYTAVLCRAVGAALYGTPQYCAGL